MSMQMGVHVSDGCSSSACALAEELAVCNYQVFLSFRGPDVRNNFINYFYKHLINLGFTVFKDREEIDHSDRIDTKIVEAIKHSEICIPVLSKDFASSAACLMEVAQMVKSKKTILPIFFGVKPYVVRHQQQTYKDSFIKHEARNNTERITEWKTALANVAENLGFEFEDVGNEHDNLIRAVSSKLWHLLKMDQEVVTRNLVGIDSGVREMMQKLGVNYQDGQVVEGQKMTGSCVVAVSGLRGVGKTTLAKEVYNRIKHLFDACSFLEGVWEAIEHRGLVPLQNQLIKDLKRRKISKVESSYQGTETIKRSFKQRSILIVLDDVDDFKQIKPLAEELTWFGPGSRIILTIRSKDVINHYKVQEIKEHEVSPMNKNHALELLCKHAFQQDHPPEGYGSVPSEITLAVGELPFAIEIVGSRLKGEKPEIWRETLGKLKAEPNKRVKVLLKESYRLLDSYTKGIFLDIACFFAGVEKTMPFYMWEAQDSFPNLGVRELQKTSFLKIGEENEFQMNNQLKILGRKIVKKEDPKNPGNRSRLWDYKDVQTTSPEKKCTEVVEAIRVTPNFNQEKECKCLHCDNFRHLSNLRFLDLDNVDIGGLPKNLLPNLLWLDWHGCREKSKLFAWSMKNLVILNLCSHQVEFNLEDWRKLMLKAGRLKVLNVKGCSRFFASLEFPASMPLKCLILEGCYIVTPKYPESTSTLENLVSLNLKRCQYFEDLPQALCFMKSLKELLIDGTVIKRLHFERSLPALEILSACECENLGEVKDSIRLLTQLRKLTLRNCVRLTDLPDVIGELVLLQEMDLSDTLIKKLPSSVDNLKILKVLKMVHTYLEEFPEAIKNLDKLEELDFTHCEGLSGDCDITRLSSLRILRLKCTSISSVLAREFGQFNSYTLELDDGVEKLSHNFALAQICD